MRVREIVVGDPELHCWCPVCGAPTRMRIPLHLDVVGSTPTAVLEICPGCGTGHDRPSVAVTPVPRQRTSPVVAAAHAVNRWLQRRHGRPALGCAHRDCPWPGRHRHQHEMTGDEGRWTYHFCTGRHRIAWAADHLIRLP